MNLAPFFAPEGVTPTPLCGFVSPHRGQGPSPRPPPAAVVHQPQGVTNKNLSSTTAQLSLGCCHRGGHTALMAPQLALICLQHRLSSFAFS